MQVGNRSSTSVAVRQSRQQGVPPAARRRQPPGVLCRAEGHAQGALTAPERLLPAGKPEKLLSSSIPALLDQLDAMTARLSALQSHHAASHSRLQAMHAELEASQAKLRQGLACLTVGVDQLGEEVSQLSPADAGAGGRSPRGAKAPRSPYAKKLGRLLARELLAQRAQQAPRG